MLWEIEVTDECDAWLDSLRAAEVKSVIAIVDHLEEKGPDLEFPYSSSVEQSRHSHMRELRIQHKGRTLRVLYAFDPRRTAILLLGGDKTGDPRWYDRNVPKADDLYDEYLEELKREGYL